MFYLRVQLSSVFFEMCAAVDRIEPDTHAGGRINRVFFRARRHNVACSEVQNIKKGGRAFGGDGTQKNMY